MNISTTAITPLSTPPAKCMMTVSQVCRSFPGARGKLQLNPSTVTRWILQGCPSISGSRIKLAASRVGGRWMISPADLEAFFASLASVKSEEYSLTPKKSRSGAHVRHEAATRAANELKRRGA